MKAVRPGFIASAVVLCSLQLHAQTARDSIHLAPGGRPSREPAPRLVPFGAPSTPAKTAQTTPPISGSIATFGASGPQQVFTSKSSVFFGVGSTATPCQSFAFLPDGTYVFQVTDRTGTTLLSTDPASERTVVVQNGVIASYSGTTHAIGPTTACGSLTIGLAPFNDAGSGNAGYVLWLTPLADFEGQPSQVEIICGTGCFHGFRPENSLAIFFRVEDKPNCPATFCASGVKFEDRNGNGVQDSGEPGLGGVEIQVTSDSGVVLSTLTNPDGTFQICGLALGQGYKISEAVPFAYSQTAPPDGTIAHRVFARGGSYFLEVCEGDVSGLNFGNQLIANAISGVKYEDLNANGHRDPGEPGVPGVTITLTPASGGAAQTTTTDANGNFIFTNLSPGDYVLTETVPTGFTQTEPASGSIPVTLASGGSSVNNAFGNFHGVLTGTISGVKFLDVNGNGVRDPGEPGQPGVTFVLSSCPSPCGQPPVASTVSAPDGSFEFTGVQFGTYFLSEGFLSGFKQTIPSTRELQVTVSLAQPSVSGILFGNQPTGAAISGTKFNDANGNGVRDPGEAGMPGVTIQLAGPGGTLSTTTDSSGNFAFTGLPPGTYVLSEMVPAGFVQTAPPPPGTATFNLAAGQVVTGVLIGNLSSPTAGSISGTKYLDINQNGVLGPPDRGFQGIVIVLTDSNGVQRQVTSDAHGNFSFTNLPPGTYTLTEIIPPGFAQTFPGTPDHPTGYTITLAPGQNATGFNFLNKC